MGSMDSFETLCALLLVLIASNMSNANFETEVRRLHFDNINGRNYNPQTASAGEEEDAVCEKIYCAYGSQCIVDKRTQRPYCRCEETCTDIFAPVCGTDGVTYSNDCQLRMASCTKQKRIVTKHQGLCDLKDPCQEKKCPFGAHCLPSLDFKTAECFCRKKCPIYVDRRYRQVCGTDGNDYLNMCELRRTSCLEKREIKVHYKGQCGKKYV